MNTISQTTTTPSAMSPAATTPATRETHRTAPTKRSSPSPRRSPMSLHAERRVDQLLAVGDFLGELGIRALFGDLDPRVVLRRRERDHLDLVLLERLHHLVVERAAFLREVVLCL